MDKQQSAQNKNILVIYELPKNQKDNILSEDTEASFSIFPNMPLLKYGFYYFIHQTKNKAHFRSTITIHRASRL